MNLETPTRTLYLYGKNGKAFGPTKAYPTPKIIKVEAELIEDLGEGVAVWKYPPNQKCDVEKFWVSQYDETGRPGTGSEWESQERALDWARRIIVSFEYNSKKRKIYSELNKQLATLEAEYKGRI